MPAFLTLHRSADFSGTLGNPKEYPSPTTSSIMATRTLIIDLGSGFLKASLSHWNEPWEVIQSIVNCLSCAENPASSEASNSPQLGIGMSYPEIFSYSMRLGHVMIWEGVNHISVAFLLYFDK